MTPFVRLAKDATLETGAVNGALLNFATGEVLSLNRAARKIVERIGAGIGWEELSLWWRRYGGSEGDLHVFCQSLVGLGVFSKERGGSKEKRLSPPDATGQRQRLRFIWIELTSACNLRCVHCYADGGEQSAKHVALGTKDVLRVMSQAAAEGCRRIQFTGGEPLLHPDLKPLILEAKSKGFSFIEVFTNSTLLNDDWAAFFEREQVRLAVSFYSHRRSVHDAITRVPRSFDLTVAAVRRLVEHGAPMRIGLVIFKQNERHVARTKAFLKDLGVDSPIRADAVRSCGRACRAAIQPVRHDGVRRRPRFVASWPSYVSNHVWNSCWAGKLAVTSSGDVLPCVFARNTILGNVREKSLSKIVHSAETRRCWRLTHDKITTCKACEYRYLCRDCRAAALNAQRGLFGKSPRCAYNPYRGTWGRK